MRLSPRAPPLLAGQPPNRRQALSGDRLELRDRLGVRRQHRLRLVLAGGHGALQQLDLDVARGDHALLGGDRDVELLRLRLAEVNERQRRRLERGRGRRGELGHARLGRLGGLEKFRLGAPLDAGELRVHPRLLLEGLLESQNRVRVIGLLPLHPVALHLLDLRLHDLDQLERGRELLRDVDDLDGLPGPPPDGLLPPPIVVVTAAGPRSSSRSPPIENAE